MVTSPPWELPGFAGPWRRLRASAPPHVAPALALARSVRPSARKPGGSQGGAPPWFHRSSESSGRLAWSTRRCAAVSTPLAPRCLRAHVRDGPERQAPHGRSPHLTRRPPRSAPSALRDPQPRAARATAGALPAANDARHEWRARARLRGTPARAARRASTRGRTASPSDGRATPMQAPYWSQGLNRYSYVFNDPVNNTDPTGFVTGNDAAAMYAPFHVPAMTTMGALGSGLGFATGPLSVGTTLLGGGAGFAQAGGTMNVAARQAAVGGGTGQGGTHATAQNTPVEPLKMPDMTPPEHLQGPDNRLACRADCYWETRGYGPQLPAEAQAAVEAGRNAGTGTVT